MRAINGLIADVPVCDAARGSLSSHPALEVLDPALGARDSQPALRRGTSLITTLPRQRALTNDQPYRFKLHLKVTGMRAPPRHRAVSLRYSLA